MAAAEKEYTTLVVISFVTELKRQETTMLLLNFQEANK